MKNIYLIIFLLFGFIFSDAQVTGLPAGFAPFEKNEMPAYLSTNRTPPSGITSPPTSPVRTMAEWEEIQSLVVTWTSYQSVLREIVRHAKEQCEVIIVCDSETQVRNYLNAFGINDTNLTFVEEDFNSIWVRDYGQNSAYLNEVDSLILIDWIYNRPRPEDDVIPEIIANLKGLPIYSTTEAPFDLVHTGGNFMSDGMGTAFSSDLVLEENGPNGFYNITVKDEAMVDQIMSEFMGISRYIKMDALPYDVIHHIDMHMKLLDEETLLVGEYPAGVADGPQIEANLQYVLSNFNSVFGTPYEVVRVPMPPDADGHYPDYAGGGWQAGDYRTYANMVYVNELVLVPVYEEQYDTTALRIISEALPGYQIEGVDCNSIIQALGAIHCITKAVGTDDPLWIVHQELDDTESPTDYQVDASIKHRSGITSADLFYEINESGTFNQVPMTLTDAANDIWTGFIPGQSQESLIRYYVDATAVNGKQQVRPLVAPEGYWEFEVTPMTTSINQNLEVSLDLLDIYPNPSAGITVVPVQTNRSIRASIEVRDLLGRKVESIFEGTLSPGSQNFFLHAYQYPAGTYLVSLATDYGIETKKLIVK